MLATVQAAGREDVDPRRREARSVGKNLLGGDDRHGTSRILRRAVDLLRQRSDELARLERWIPGNPSAKPPPLISSPAPTCWNITPD
ncbi:hypothetical protein MJ575_08465 [Klebsiella pneumoniae]|nr:hypothetical protein MJ575_08465 [Klebsiella pneumoniae]